MYKPKTNSQTGPSNENACSNPNKKISAQTRPKESDKT